MSFSGRVVTAGETGKGARLYSFEPVTVSFEESLRNNYIYWLQELRKMTPQQRLEAGYTYSYINNSPFRNWLRGSTNTAAAGPPYPRIFSGGI